MPRKRSRKTERGKCDITKYEDGYEEVKLGTSLRRAAEMHVVNQMFLLRYMRKRDGTGAGQEEQEQQLSKYITHCAEIYFGLSPKEVRYHDHFVRDGPVGSIGTANPSGWMQDASFLVFLEHFKKFSSASPTHSLTSSG